MVVTNQPAVTPEVTGLGQSEHDKAMLVKVEGTPPATPQRPEHIPEKFWDAEKGVVKTDELAKSYSELEKVRSGKPPEAPAAKPAEGQPPVDAATKAAEEAAKAAGADTSKLDFSALTQEYSANGSLSEATYENLQKAGLPKAMVDAHIAGLEAQATLARQEAFTMAGGEEQFTSMLQWAGSNLPKAEQEAFDAAVIGTSAQRNMAVSGLMARFTAAVGANPSLVRGAGAAATSGAYQSRQEVVAAMRDPRYKTDSAYRASVERRLGDSSVF